MPIKYFKGQPSDFIIKYSGDKLVSSGRGISFFFWKPTTTILKIPGTTTDAYFIFNENTQTFQTVSIQGQVTFRVKDPVKLSDMLDFSIDNDKMTYKSNDPEKLTQRIINTIQGITRGEIQKLSLEDTLKNLDSLSKIVYENTAMNEVFESLGVEIINIYFTSIKPQPEIAKALEADYRETLLKKADEAIYSRRAAAVEQEKIIKENELMSQISLEKDRGELIDLSNENALKEAETKAKASSLQLDIYKDVDPKTLLSIGIKSITDAISNSPTFPDLITALLYKKG